jgi:Dolichyl-phosphate-mannose-protein mannosyltransferase
VVFAYLAGRQFASRRAGLIAAALVALNPYRIWYSQEARSYGTLVLLGAIALYFFARARNDPTRRSLIGWATASSLALLTHYFAVFFIVPEALLLLLSLRTQRRRTAVAVIAVGAVGLALLPVAVIQEGTGRANGFTQFPVAQRAETALVKYATVEGAAPEGGILSTTPAQRQIGHLAAALVGLAVVLVAIRGSPRERLSAGIAAGVALTAIAAPLILAWGGFDFVDPRNLIGAVVPALVGLAIAFGVRAGADLGTLGALGCSVLFVFALHAEATTPALQRHDWRAAAAALPERPVPSLLVVPEDGRTPLKYYTGRKLDKFVPKHYAGGVATRRIVVVSDYLPVRSPDPRFRLVGTRTAPQHWTIEVFAARHPVVVGAGRLAAKQVMPQPSTLLARGRPVLLAAEQRADARAAPGRSRSS